MSQGFKRGSKWKINNPAYLFLYLFSNSNEQLGDQPSHDNCIPCIAERYKVSGSSYENVNYVRLCDLYLQKRKEIESNLTRKKLHRTSQGSNFLVNSFTNRDNAIAPIQFRRERQPYHLKRWFFLKNRSMHFSINSTSIIRLVKWN